MDPNATWEQMAAAVSAGRWEEATATAEDLSVWLSKGGFPPRVTGRQNFDRIVATAACRAVATWDVG